MGQASSQLEPKIEPAALAEEHTSLSGNALSHKKRKLKRPSATRKDVPLEEMDSHSDDYGLAASSQLTIGEEDPGALKEVVNQRKRKRHSGGNLKRSKKVNHYGKVAQQENEGQIPQEREGNMGSPTQVNRVIGVARDGDNDLDLVNDHSMPPSTLDEINSADEDVASFLRDFEKDALSLPPNSSQLDQLLDDKDSELRSTLPSSSLPSLDSHCSKRNSNSGKTLHSPELDLPHPEILNSAEEDNVSLSSTGQHTPDPNTSIDFEAFDSYCAANGIGSANIFEADHVLPGIEDTPQSSQEYRISAPGSPSPSQHGSFNVRSASAVGARTWAKSRRKSKGKSSLNGKNSQDSDSSVEEVARTGGAFTNAEKIKLEDYRDRYCEEHDISIWQFNDMVQSIVKEKPKAKTMWLEMYELLPYRKKVSIQRFCRRRFHNFDVRGAWTVEDDQLLANAVEEKGKSWVAVAQILNRSQEDVRDRWRNYHVNSESRNKEQWTDVEVGNLVTAVYDCINLMRDARRQSKREKYEGRDVPESEPESDEEAATAKLINWQVVSDKMGGSRSRLQCSFKWARLRKQTSDQYLKQLKASQQGLSLSDLEHKPKTKVTWRAKMADKRVQEMRPGDLYDFLQAISTCQAAQEGNIPWRLLGDDDFRRRWTTADRKGAWRMLKGSVVNATEFNYQEIVNHLLNNLMVNAGDRLDEKWDPERNENQMYDRALLPKTKMRRGEVDKKMRAAEKLKRQRERRKAKKAAERPTAWTSKVNSSRFVGDSDEE